MPTNVIPFAGIPATQQFISISPHFPDVGIGQRRTYVFHSTSSPFVETVVGPSAGGVWRCAGANDGPIALWENQRQPRS